MCNYIYVTFVDQYPYLFSSSQIPGSVFATLGATCSASRPASPLRDRCRKDFVRSPDLIRRGAVDICLSEVGLAAPEPNPPPTLSAWHSVDGSAAAVCGSRYYFRQRSSPAHQVWRLARSSNGRGSVRRSPQVIDQIHLSSFWEGTSCNLNNRKWPSPAKRQCYNVDY